MLSNRIKILSSLINDYFVGCELGVAKGYFSNEILSFSKIRHLYSIDIWAGDRGHNDSEFIYASRLLSKHRDKNTIIRKKFCDAVLDFSDSFFDFIYIDGYAHTGQDNGKTLYDWWPKLKNNGIFSGHDYDSDWPKTIEQIDVFTKKYNLSLHIIEDTPYNSWYIIK